MPKLRVGELDMYYEFRGQGPPLVMIMGLSGHAGWWEPAIVEDLAQDFRLLLFDNRDAGRTTGPPDPGPYTIRDMAADTAGLMERLGLGRAHVLGLSMGGMVAQELALGYPDKVDRLVLGCTTPGLSRGVPPSAEVLVELTAGREGRSLADLAASLLGLLFTAEWVERNSERLPVLLGRLAEYPIRPEAYRRQLAAIASFDPGERLETITTPTLVLHGDRDILVPPENGAVLARAIPGARLVILPGCAHALGYERPDLFTGAVREFLAAPQEGEDAGAR
ncbi:MAG: alpha/beta fold hydrolase [Bacillota bacterium]